MISGHQRRQLLGIALMTLALFTALSLVPLEAFGEAAAGVFPDGNVMGVLGMAVSRGGYAALGFSVLFVPVLLGLAGAFCFGWVDSGDAGRWAAFLMGLAFLVPPSAAFLAPGSGVELADALPARAPGWLGRTLALPLVAVLGWFGAGMLLVACVLALSIATIGWNPASAAVSGVFTATRRVPWRLLRWRRRPRPDHAAVSESPWAEIAEAADASAAAASPDPAAAIDAGTAGDQDPGRRGGRGAGLLERATRRRIRKRAARDRTGLDDFGDPESTDRPPLAQLSEPPARDASLRDDELDHLGDVLIRTLATFKVQGEIAGRTTGPVVTQFEVVPAPGVKVNRIAALDADLALALRAPSIRIVAPIPGKGAVGVEVPNPEPETVYLRPILESAAFQRSTGQLPIALGKDLTGRPYVADLVRMPHLLIAGTTGSGKSICINTVITSLIYRHSPKSLRLLLIDPKMVELSMYENLPHLRHPVVTDPQDAATVLKWAVLEMERRYELLSENGARSLTEFNRRVAEGQSLRRAHPEGDEDDPGRWVYQEGELPYIVAVVDELADLMMTVQAEIEKPLAQLAQKARAIGIHLIVATQRPSVNVITGLIKANFPCRIAFRVSSKVDSRTILDQNGADALLGNGDMLFLPPGHSDPVRIQGAYIPTEDTERIMAWYRERLVLRPVAESEEDILDVVRSREEAEEPSDQIEAFEERDALFRQAAEICVQFQQGSTSLLQRRLRIGYGRAARIIDQLHNAGVLGPPDGSKPREILVGMESIEHICREEPHRG